MTRPPPPAYPPPPPGGYPPPPGWYPPHQPPRRVLPKAAYTPWSRRVWAFLIDWAPIYLVFLVPMVGLLITDGSECWGEVYGSNGDLCTTTSATVWVLVQFGGLFLGAPIYFLWNFCYRQGKTGQSIGKSALKFMVISEKTWLPIGFWMSLVRQLAHYIDQLICNLGYFWPLWDDQRQTLADKICSTVCVPVTSAAPD